MEYIIVAENYIESLTKRVQSHINNGFKPQGGVSVSLRRTPMGTSSCDDKIFCQAMVKS